MGGKRVRKPRLPSAAAALAAIALLLTAGAASGAAVSEPERAAEPVFMKQEAAAPAVKKAAVPDKISPAAPKEKARQEEDVFGPVPETEPVEDTYFDDAVFLGDSRTEGLFLYSGLKHGHAYTAVGATVESVFTKKNWETESGEKIPLLDAVAAQDCGKIYIMLGINELGWTKTSTFHDQYAKLIDRLREDHPGARVVLQSIPPVSAKQDAKQTYVNNERILVYNEAIRALAEEKECFFLDVAECLTGGDGVLPVKQTTDGIHFNVSGCGTWLNYLRTHSLGESA